MCRSVTNKNFVAWLLLISMSFLWGSSFILTKRALSVFSAQEIAALRVVAAAVLLLPWSLPWLRRLCWHHYKSLLLVGLAGFVLPAFLYAQAQVHLDSAINGVLTSLTPMFALLVGRLCFQRPVFRREVWGSLLGLVGALLLILAGTGYRVSGVSYYVLLPLLGCVSDGLNANLLKHRLQDLSTSTIISVSLLLMGIIAGGMLLTQGVLLHKLRTGEGVYLALGCVLLLGASASGAAYLLFAKLVKLTSPVFASMSSSIIPLVALGWGLLDGEVLLVGHYVGISTILMGVYLVSKPE